MEYIEKVMEVRYNKLSYLCNSLKAVRTTKLSTLKLGVGGILAMEYDYGVGWEFEIELLSITEMKRGEGTHYPYVQMAEEKELLRTHHHMNLLKLS